MGLSRVLGRLPPRLAIYAIEGHSFREGDGLSPEADRAANEVAALFMRKAPRDRSEAGPRERAEPPTAGAASLAGRPNADARSSRPQVEFDLIPR